MKGHGTLRIIADIRPFVYVDEHSKAWSVEGGTLEITGASIQDVENKDGSIEIRGRVCAIIYRRASDEEDGS